MKEIGHVSLLQVTPWRLTELMLVIIIKDHWSSHILTERLNFFF